MKNQQKVKTMTKTVNSASDERTINNVMGHQFRVLSEAEKTNMQAIKDMGLDFHNSLEKMEKLKGRSREISIAKTKIEEAVMWATKHITA